MNTAPYRTYPNDAVNYPNGQVPPDIQKARALLETSCRFLERQWQALTQDELWQKLFEARSRIWDLAFDSSPMAGHRSQAVENQVLVAERMLEGA